MKRLKNLEKELKEMEEKKLKEAKELSRCYSCGVMVHWTKKHLIPFQPGRKMLPVCNECLDKLKPEEILEHCKQLINDWKTLGPLDFDENEALKTIEEYIKGSANGNPIFYFKREF